MKKRLHKVVTIVIAAMLLLSMVVPSLADNELDGNTAMELESTNLLSSDGQGEESNLQQTLNTVPGAAQDAVQNSLPGQTVEGGSDLANNGTEGIGTPEPEKQQEGEPAKTEGDPAKNGTEGTGTPESEKQPEGEPAKTEGDPANNGTEGTGTPESEKQPEGDPAKAEGDPANNGTEGTGTPELEKQPEGTPEDARTLAAVLTHLPRYAVAGEPFEAVITIAGGQAPWTVTAVAKKLTAEGTVEQELASIAQPVTVGPVSGDAVEAAEASEATEEAEATMTAAASAATAISISLPAYGKYALQITITDAAGASTELTGSMPVSSKEVEELWQWTSAWNASDLPVEWGPRVAAIAASQLGYTQNWTNFQIDDQDQSHFYTRYGHWAGHPYAPWSGAFVRFCLAGAGIDMESFPVHEELPAWMEILKQKDLFGEKDSDYEPKAGDIVFLHLDLKQLGTPADLADAAGIIGSVDDAGIHVIEGDRDGQVQQITYALSDGRILGFGALNQAYARRTDSEVEKPAFEKETVLDGVKIRVTAEEGVFPADAVLYVQKVPVGEQAQVDAAVEQLREEQTNVAVSYTFDIKVLAADGVTEIQPP